jgi:hypothetical protein
MELIDPHQASSPQKQVAFHEIRKYIQKLNF